MLRDWSRPWFDKFLFELRVQLSKLRNLILLFVRKLPRPLALGLPRGFFYDYNLLNAKPPQVTGRVILTDQGNIEAAPDSMLILCGRAQHKLQPWPIFWTHHHEIELIGPSLVHMRNDLVSAEACYGKTRVISDPAYNYRKSRLSQPVYLPGNWTNIASRWMPTNRAWAYGHWLFDALPRLALLDEFPSDTKIIVPPHQLPYQVSSLEMLGLLDRCRWTEEIHLRVEDYYFSSPTAMVVCYNPYAVNWLRKSFLPLITDSRPTPKRFFVRRAGNNRNMTNESEVLDLVREFGWEIIDPGDLSFSDQIRYFSNAEAISGIHGSGLMNVVWCQPGCRILELYCADYMGSESEWIAKCIPSVEHRHLIFPSDPKWNAIIDLKRLREALQSF